LTKEQRTQPKAINTDELARSMGEISGLITIGRFVCTGAAGFGHLQPHSVFLQVLPRLIQR
jgi:hypothetical protein